MMALLSLRDARAIQEDRLRRARRRRAAAGVEVLDSFIRPRSHEADVVEVFFGTACEAEQIGA